MKKIFLLLLLNFCNALLYTVNAQPKEYKQTIDWNKNSYIFNINNENSNYNLNYSILIENNENISTVKLIESSYTPLSNSELSSIQKNYKPSEQSKINFETSINRKVKYLNFSVNALRYNKSNKQIEKINNFVIEYTTTKSLKSAKINNKVYAKNSVLKNGDWYKIEIDTSGIFKITYDEIVSLGIQNPENIEVFGNGGKQLPYMNADFNHDDLIENPIYMEKGSDGVFNGGDYILFYGEGPTQWSYDENNELFKHNLHCYANNSFYFLTTGQGQKKRIQLKDESNLSPNNTSNSFDSYRYLEDEKTNLIRSGRRWWGDQYKQNEIKEYNFTFPNLVSNSIVRAKTNIAGRRSSGSQICYFNIKYNNQVLSEIPISNPYVKYVWGYQYSDDFSFTPISNDIVLEYSFTGGNASIDGFIDYIILNAREKLSMNKNTQLQFRDQESTLLNNVTEFTINDSESGLMVWNITDPLNPSNIKTTALDSKTSFIAKSDSLLEFIAFNANNAYKAILTSDELGKIENQDLHGLSNQDMVIVTHPDFIIQANEIAELHREQDNLKVFVTTPELIYNEFSSGKPDVSAIRNFVRMLYDRSTSENNLIKYLLLMGDGSYDNRNTASSNSNYILTYQSEESLHETSSYVTDDFFGLLDSSEGGGNGTLDIGIGRYPVQDTAEAQAINDKVKTYLSEKSLGSWRNQICFIGDDADSNTHMKQPDAISKTLNRDYPEYNINKIYLDAYPRKTTPMGHRYPDVTKAINEQVKKGALIIDYVGHGNPRLLTHEEVLTIPDVKSWRNDDKLSIFVTASCEVGRYDDYDRTSLGEWMVLNEYGGGVAALTTTRVVYSGANDELNTNFFRYVLKSDLRLGDVIRLAKANTGTGINKRNFSLLGDPALKLAVPENNAAVSYINDRYIIDEEELMAYESTLTTNEPELKSIAINVSSDTLKALSKANVAGEIYNNTGDLISDYNGIIQVSIYDKPDSITCYGHTTITQFAFEIQNSVLYKGQASITNGLYAFDFIIPKDINYKYGNGKISLYAKSEMGEAIGYSNNLVIGGVDENAESDNFGPVIELFINDTSFITNGITNENPILIAQLSDESGINTTGNGVGHNITAILDGDQANMIVLNSFYQGNVDEYNSGEVLYPFYDLSPGQHNIIFKVWDIYNNSSESEITFNVFDENEIIINNLKNTPNPFKDETYFILDHNQTKDVIKVTINIYNLLGNKVAQVIQNENSGSYTTSPIYWNGTGFGGAKLPKGMYLYEAQIKAVDGNINTQSSKLMIFE